MYVGNWSEGYENPSLRKHLFHCTDQFRPSTGRVLRGTCRDEFNEIPELFKPVFHTLMLIWKHSKYYAQPSRIVTIIREICNSLIEKAMTAGEGMHRKEPQEAVDTLRMILRVLGTFKRTYFDYKNRLCNEAPERQWKVPSGALFQRLDVFMDRCNEVLDINLTSMQFSKLGGDRGVEIGGTKGTRPTENTLLPDGRIPVLLMYRSIPKGTPNETCRASLEVK
jgi:hypothetical protein